MQSIASNTGSVIGPMLAGVVIASLGQAYTYLFNAISFIAVIVALFLIGQVIQDTKKSSGVNSFGYEGWLPLHLFPPDHPLHHAARLCRHFLCLSQHHDAHRGA
jgi:MFS family permease